MKVFCPEHKRGFLAPRQSPIKCENRGHMLGELDFEGEAKLPIEIQWQYCCNCGHFCPIDFSQGGLEQCAVCNRRSSARYLCDRCFTISFESDTQIQTKNFTLTSEGAPQPSCPGCLHSTSADLREHTCDEVGASFITALNSCPICLERLDIAPSFPSSVAYYLKRRKAANKLTVTFDYETDLFVPVEDGEFVLISNGNEDVQPILLPRAARFSARRDFYEFYQDYYYCTKPEAGEVHIIQPASVTPVANGWKLQTPGVLEVLDDQPGKKVPTKVTRHQIDASEREESKIIEEIKEESPVTACTHCGSLVETKYAFCWTCGKQLTRDNEPSVTRWEKPSAILPSVKIAREEEDSTGEHQVVSIEPPIFSFGLAREPERSTLPKSAIHKLVAAALAGVVVSIGLFVLMRSASRTESSIDAQGVGQNAQVGSNLTPGREADNNAQVGSNLTPGREADNVAAEPASVRTSARHKEDQLLNKLRERRITAGVSDRPAILKVLAKTEKQYPNDYRFPYERAKLALKGTRSRDEAFAALSLAAEKAINTGKAHEMLNGLKTDKSGDFRKLSHGHHEWTQLEEALKNNDKNLLHSEAQ